MSMCCAGMLLPSRKSLLRRQLRLQGKSDWKLRAAAPHVLDFPATDTCLSDKLAEQKP